MKKVIIALVVLAIVALGTYYLVFNGKVISSNGPGIPTVSEVTITMKDFAFNPARVTVTPGTKVTWVNEDNVSHTITSDSGNLLNSPTLAPRQSFSFTFTNAGSVNYHCNIHPMMKGTVTITN